MNIDSRLKKIEAKVLGNGKGVTLYDILRWFPEEGSYIPDDHGRMINLRQLCIEKLPNIGPVDLGQFFDILPLKFKEEVIQVLRREDYHNNEEKQGYARKCKD